MMVLGLIKPGSSGFHQKNVVFQMHKKWHHMGALQISQDMNEHSVQTLAFAVFYLTVRCKFRYAICVRKNDPTHHSLHGSPTNLILTNAKPCSSKW